MGLAAREIKFDIYRQIKTVALGNTRRGFKEVASDLLNNIGKDQVKDMCEGTFLCRQTLERVMDCDENYSPRSDTLERIFKFCNAEVSFSEVPIRKAYRNQPKEET